MVGTILKIPKLGETCTLTQHEVQCFYGHQVKPYQIEDSEHKTDGSYNWNKLIEKHQVTPVDLTIVEKPQSNSTEATDVSAANKTVAQNITMSKVNQTKIVPPNGRGNLTKNNLR